ncbi:hypothetical protein CHARACLAT_001618, partial [Characodon lateralis]|nr:hypothetical protein [Characodon lateralis]
THHPVSSNHSSLAAPINGKSALLLGQSSPKASLLKTFCMKDTTLLLSFDPPPPLLHATTRIGSQGGKTYLIIIIRCLFKLIFILSVHVSLRGPSAKEIIFQ